MNLILFTTVGNTLIYVNPFIILAVSINLDGQTILIHGENTEHDCGYFTVKGSPLEATERINRELNI